MFDSTLGTEFLVSRFFSFTFSELPVLEVLFSVYSSFGELVRWYYYYGFSWFCIIYHEEMKG